jgi:PAS domain S-box-containing protein
MGWDGDNCQSRGAEAESTTAVDGSGVLAELVDEAVFRVTADGSASFANSRFEILTGVTEADLVGGPLSSVVVEADADKLAAVVRALGTQPVGDQTALGISLRTNSDDAVACQLSLAVVPSPANGQTETNTEIIGIVRPVDTAEAELERRAKQQAAVATLGQLALESDDLDELMAEASRLVGETLDCAYCKVLDLNPDREELLLRQGVGWQEGLVGTATVDSNTNSQAGYTLQVEQPVVVENLDTETRFAGPELLTSHDVISGISVVIGNSDETLGILGVHDTRHRQFTDDDTNFVQSVANVLASAIDRHDRTNELQRYEQIIETVNDGVYTVDPEGRFTMVNEACCELTGYDRQQLLGAETSLLVDRDVRTEIAEIEAEMASGDVEPPTIEFEFRTSDGEVIAVEATFSMLSTDTDWERVGVVRDISERKAYEKRLETKRTKLAALNEVNTVVREITEAILDQSTRHEIEQQVCESLAAFDSYRFAWIGEVDSRTGDIEPHAEAGAEGYFDEVTISTDPTDPMSRGPAGRAVETQVLQVSQNVFTDPQFEPWRDIAEAWGYQSVAVIPITYNGTLYGILGLYSDSVDAFAVEKQAIIEQLGEIIGHAIASVERKQALMSDAVTELEFEVRDVFSPVDTQDSFNDEIILDHVVPVGGDMYLQYGRTTPEMAPILELLEAQHPSYESCIVLTEYETEITFELRVTAPPVTSLIADAGGAVQEATITDSDLQITAHLPQTADVRRILSRIQAQYPVVRPIARRQVSRSETSPKQIISTWSEALTDRQRASLEAAYFAGFFEWPRNSSGQDLAEAMGVSPATFHQHLRAAELKLFRVLIDDPETRPSIPQ